MEEPQQPNENLKLLIPLIYEKNRFALLSLLSERNESVNLLSMKLGLRGKNIRKHLRILENAQLVERLAPLPSPIDPRQKFSMNEFI